MFIRIVAICAVAVYTVGVRGLIDRAWADIPSPCNPGPCPYRKRKCRRLGWPQ